MSLQPAGKLILPGTITANLLAPGLVGGGSLPVATTTYALSHSDSGFTLYFTNASGCAITLPNHATAGDIGIGFNVDWVQGVGAGQLTFTGQSGDTVLYYSPSSAGSAASVGVGSTGSMRITRIILGPAGARVWSVSGGLV